MVPTVRLCSRSGPVAPDVVLARPNQGLAEQNEKNQRRGKEPPEFQGMKIVLAQLLGKGEGEFALVSQGASN